MRALVIGHDHIGGVEHLGEQLATRGYQLTRFTVVAEERFTRPGGRAEFPDPSGWDLVVTLGAPWPRPQIASWAGDEVAFLQRARRGGAAVLGICCGAQLLAESLGGGTTQLEVGRVGWRSVDPRVPGVGAGPWFQWHAEQLVAPAGAEVLAESSDGVEAFRIGRCAGVQFHPEMTSALLERWLALPGGPPSSVDTRALRASTARLAPQAAACVPALLDVLVNCR